MVICDRSDTVSLFDVRKNAIARSFKVTEVNDAIFVPAPGGGPPQLFVAGGSPTGTIEVYSSVPDARGQLPLLRSVRAHTSWCERSLSLPRLFASLSASELVACVCRFAELRRRYLRFRVNSAGATA